MLTAMSYSAPRHHAVQRRLPRQPSRLRLERRHPQRQRDEKEEASKATGPHQWQRQQRWRRGEARVEVMMTMLDRPMCGTGRGKACLGSNE